MHATRQHRIKTRIARMRQIKIKRTILSLILPPIVLTARGE